MWHRPEVQALETVPIEDRRVDPPPTEVSAAMEEAPAPPPCSPAGARTPPNAAATVSTVGSISPIRTEQQQTRWRSSPRSARAPGVAATLELAEEPEMQASDASPALLEGWSMPACEAREGEPETPSVPPELAAAHRWLDGPPEPHCEATGGAAEPLPRSPQRAAAQQTLGGLHEPISEAGYEAVAQLRDECAMKAFIARAVEEAGGTVEDEVALCAAAAAHCSGSGECGYAELWEELTSCAWATLPQQKCGRSSAGQPPEAVASTPSPARAPGLRGACCPRWPGETLPIEPRSGPASGGAQLHWVGESSPPFHLFVGSRPCAALPGGVFIAPMCSEDFDGVPRTVDVLVASKGHGQEAVFEGAFTFWAPGQLQGVEPCKAELAGGVQVRIRTSDLGAVISEVLIGGSVCEFARAPSATEAVVLAPAASSEGSVSIQVNAPNGNSATLEGGFKFYVPEAFGLVGERVALADEGTVATRTGGVNKGILLGAHPARRVTQGRYFEIRVDGMCRSMRTIAVGFTARRPEDAAASNGHLRATEARELDRAWLAGYDKGGALSLSDGNESKIPSSAWRPVTQLRVGSRIGVLWMEFSNEGKLIEPALCIFQDGQERVRLPAAGRLPALEEDLFAVVDLQGSASAVSLLQGALPAAQPE